MSSTDEYPCDGCGSYYPVGDLITTDNGACVCPDCFFEIHSYEDWMEEDF